ncbi:ASKHA domain-containing protein [Clostridium tepidum]|uniref:(Fe-S)-binding protein n=1 Tax=Clostridium tepidum TaxID=1962263 RepID=A0A1S9I4Z1_9CLOT|nr:ASKHA domain-containing protein [Clostridium tepidum]OOO62743.1 (Fe-S)-binding protein [Clostridium tepidum]OOO65424.1 (Fe-S)-binding protein [Clostridium tepidum]
MARITFIKNKLEIEVEKGTKLIECIRKAGLNIETPCNGKGICGKCKVIARGNISPKTKEEEKFTEAEHIRLACMCEVIGDAQIELIEKDKNKKLKTINKGYSIETKLDSKIKKVKLNDIDEKNNIPYKDTLKFATKKLSVLKKIGKIEKNKGKELCGVIYKEELIDIIHKDQFVLAVAVDIGTTGLSAYLLNLEDGQILNKISDLNPQTEYGGDVLSRITYCMENKDGIEILSKCIRGKINSMMDKLIGSKYERKNVYEIAIVANTTMLHLFTGVNPNTIAKAPYRSIFLDQVEIKARDISIEINEEGNIILLPSLSSYVGADIVAGIVATDFQNKKHPSIFIDIGTNGELAAIYKGNMSASSTAAGPAFEGMNISCGSRAEEGAIDNFYIDENYNIKYSTIGDKEAKSICGSGLMDVMAALIKSKVVMPSGRFNKNMPDKLKEKLKDKKFYITDNVYISQNDVRQIQLAKGAISSGVTMLLKEIDANIEDIEEAVIAGAFGYHINPESIKILGIIPKGFKGKITFVGNSSIEGARLSLLNKDISQAMINIRKNIRVVELSTREDFQNYFVKALAF